MIETHGIHMADVLLKELTILDREPFTDKDQLFQFISGEFEKNGVVSDKEAFQEALMYRESLGPTYMGDDIAIPHGRCKEVLKSGVGFIRLKDSFRYESAGEAGPVKYIFVLAVNEAGEDNEHLRILATLAGYLMQDEFRELMINVQSYEELLAGIQTLATQE
ncbi:PTS mannose transporter subunit IIAB [Bacteroidia bacterium]|nr:PTS mannose transporter subunit IIAB [Bacteroidia bacterium]